MALEHIQKLIESPMAEVEALLSALVLEVENPHTRKWMLYFMEKKGHRLRPLLTLLAFGAVGMNEIFNKQVISMAVCTELLHSASLIHDDVIDEETTRRDQPALNQHVGNKPAVLIGNIFYLKAFELSSAFPVLDYFNEMMKTSMNMCVGEIVQNDFSDELLTSEVYESIIEKKTANLMALCTFSGAKFAGATELQMSCMREMGLQIGYLYQIRDDLKDGDVHLLEGVSLSELSALHHQKFETACRTFENSFLDNNHDQLKPSENLFLEGLKQLEKLIVSV